MKPDGTDARQITGFGPMSWAPYSHPSGQYFIFASNKLGFENFELFIVDTQGTKEPVRVTYSDGFDGLPVPSPDGTQLAWTSSRSGGSGPRASCSSRSGITRRRSKRSRTHPPGNATKRDRARCNHDHSAPATHRCRRRSCSSIVASDAAAQSTATASRTRAHVTALAPSSSTDGWPARTASGSPPTTSSRSSSASVRRPLPGTARISGCRSSSPRERRMADRV